MSIFPFYDIFPKWDFFLRFFFFFLLMNTLIEGRQGQDVSHISSSALNLHKKPNKEIR